MLLGRSRAVQTRGGRGMSCVLREGRCVLRIYLRNVQELGVSTYGRNSGDTDKITELVYFSLPFPHFVKYCLTFRNASEFRMSRHVSLHECELLLYKSATGLDLFKAVTQLFRKVQLSQRQLSPRERLRTCRTKLLTGVRSSDLSQLHQWL